MADKKLTELNLVDTGVDSSADKILVVDTGTNLEYQSPVSAVGSYDASVEKFTTTGSWNPDLSSLISAWVFIVGGGGGGGGARSLDSASMAAGGGGGSGEQRIGVFNASDFDTGQITITIGAGGAGGLDTGSNGLVGGKTEFGDTGTQVYYMSARGGDFGSGVRTTGYNRNIGGEGGLSDGSGGDFGFATGAGNDGKYVNDGDGQAQGGEGAPCFHGGMVMPNLCAPAASAVAGRTGRGNGQGGSGAAAHQANVGAAGGAGTDGCVLIISVVGG